MGAIVRNVVNDQLLRLSYKDPKNIKRFLRNWGGLEGLSEKGDTVATCILTDLKDKVTRAMRRSANFENHKVYFREGMDDLEECLLLFPEVDHDDLFDALDFAMTMADGGNEIRVLKREDFRI